MKTLFDGVYMLEGEVGGRPLQLIYLQGRSTSVLFDTGSAGDPEKFVMPQIREAGGDPTGLTWIINSHSDFDHTGGNYEMKRVAPAAILACGHQDREACTSPEDIIRLRYDSHRADDQVFYDDDTLAYIRQASGQRQSIDVTFVGGEQLHLDDDWDVQILHVPGHSKGHLALLDRKHGALYAGDAIHGAVYLNFDGEPRLCPTYLHIDDYLNTIRLIRHLPINSFVGCHWPVKRDDEIVAFCDESLGFVQRAELLLRDLLKQPHTLREICETLGPQLGDWPREVDIELVYAMKGHVAQLIDRGIVSTRERQNQPRLLEYILA